MTSDLLPLLGARRGHFRLESGHHGDLWLDLDSLFARPTRLAPFLAALADRLAAHALDAIAGPLTGGAFVGFAVAARLDLRFVPAERHAGAGAIRYRIPDPLRPDLAGLRFAVVDDVINAGSAASATCADLRSLGADVRALGALAVLGDRASRLGLPIETTLALDNALWSPAECPLCSAGTPLEDLVPSSSASP